MTEEEFIKLLEPKFNNFRKHYKKFRRKYKEALELLFRKPDSPAK